MGITANGISIRKLMVRRGASGAYQPYRKAYANGVQVFSSGADVIYHLRAGKEMIESAEHGQDVLNPSTFRPQDHLPEANNGWSFRGWRSDRSASGTVLSSMTMKDEEIHLYAVYSRDVALTYHGNGGTSSSGSSWRSPAKTVFYNNGNYAFPQFTLEANFFSRSNHKFTTWALGSTSGTRYGAGETIEVRDNTSVYAMWQITSLAIASWFEVHGVAQGGTVSKTIGTFDLMGLDTLTAVLYKQNYNGGGSGGTIGIYINGNCVIYEDRFTSSRNEETYTVTANISDYGANSKITTVATGNNEDVLVIKSMKAT